MSNFKTHKITPAKKTQKNPPEKDTVKPKKTRNLRKWIIGSLIGIASIIFVGNVALRAV